VSGPFSLASNLVGFDCLLYGIADMPESVGKALRHLIQGQIEFAEEIERQGLDVAFFESAAAPPLLPPRSFEEIELPALVSVIEQVADVVGHPVPCIVGGDTLPILDSMLKTGTGYVICPWETDQAPFMDRMKAHPDIMVRVNTDPGVFASGDLSGVRRELDRIIALVKDRDKACIGTGALPFETNPDIVLQAKAYVQDKFNNR
jgi:uroporphyrinogen-III decarboxylase